MRLLLPLKISAGRWHRLSKRKSARDRSSDLKRLRKVKRLRVRLKSNK